MDSNPYKSPARASALQTGMETAIVPSTLVESTRKVVTRFGWFQFAWPFLVAYGTDSLFIDVWALFIASNGKRIQKTSFKRFPWTALMCCAYPVVFIVSLANSDIYSIQDWLPTRFSPVLFLQMVSSIWSIIAIYYIVRCHLSHRRYRSRNSQ